MDNIVDTPLDKGSTQSTPTQSENSEAVLEPAKDGTFEFVQEQKPHLLQKDSTEVSAEYDICVDQAPDITDTEITQDEPLDICADQTPDITDTEITQDEPLDHEIQDTAAVNYSVKFSKFSEGFQPAPLGQVSFNTYTRGCKWSPDGLCILSLCDDNRLTIYDTPPDQASSDFVLQPAVTMKEAETVYDFQWFPLMDSNKPETCCLATTSQYQPIHLYDAFDGHLRATYRCFDHLDEMVAARSLAFDPHGEKLYVGLKNEIRVFDVNIPGRECETRKTLLKKRKKHEIGLSGIISCIAFNPVMPSVYALGTYSRHLGVYVEPLTLVCMHEGQQKGGITHIQFSPDGTKLLAGGRKDKEILVWDLRNPGTLYAILHREVMTNQRIYFDISNCGQYVVSGGSDAKMRIWDLKSDLSKDHDDPVIDPMWIGADLHSDCINGVAVHPWRPYIATSSGQRHFYQASSEESDTEEERSTATEVKTAATGVMSKTKTSKDFSLKFWNFDQLNGIEGT